MEREPINTPMATSKRCSPSERVWDFAARIRPHYCTFPPIGKCVKTCNAVVNS